MVQQVLQRFDFTYSSPQSTPLPTGGVGSSGGGGGGSGWGGGRGGVLGGQSPVVLTGHADASWADDQTTQRSSQGYTFSLGSGSVSWRATRSSSVLSSSCEAEIYAGAMAAQELRWLTYLLTDLGEPPRSPPVLYVYNKAMLALCREQRLEHRTKHIALRYFLARELQQRGQLRLAYVASEANTADVFTKALAPCDHQRFCTQLACFVLPYLTGLVTHSPPPLRLWGTSGMGLVLGGRARVVLTGHADASWFDDLATQRSSQGYTFSLGSDSVSWRSTHSSSVLSSSCEAEIYAGAMAAQELRWLTYLLTDLGEAPHSPPVLYVDNKAMLALCQEHRLEHRTKHIALRYFLARELQQRGQLRLAYVASQANTADVFTKALQPCDHQPCFVFLDWSLEGVGVVVGVVVVVEVSAAAVEAVAAVAAAVVAEEEEVAEAVEAVVEQVAALHRGVAPVVVSASSSSAVLRPPPLSSLVSGTLGVSEVEMLAPAPTFSVPGTMLFPDATEIPRWGDLSRAGVAVFDLDYDAILAAMYALSTSDEGDCYLCVSPDPGIQAAALGAGETAALGARAYAAPGAGESAPSGTESAHVLHTFTLDSGASRSFFRDRTTLTPLSRPVVVSLADPSGGPILASFSTVLPCPAAPSGFLSGLYLPSFSTNLVSGADLQDQGVDQFTPASQRVTHCTCARTGRHLATFTRRPGSSLYTLSTASSPVSASGQVAASSQVLAAASGSGPESAPCSCCLLSHQTLLWHHRLGHPSLPRLRGMASRVLVSGLPRSLPPLPSGPAPACIPCVEGRQRAAPHSSEFPPIEAPLQTLHMDVWGPARVRGQGHERYILLVVDDYSRYTTVFPLRSKGEVTEVLIDWIRAARLRLRESFGSDFPVLRLHSDRGGEFSSARLGAFCRAQGIRQTFTLPASPQKNGIADRRIGMVMDVARTSMIHAAAPHFLWPFAVQYAAHQLNLQPRVSLPETSPTLLWTGKVGDASAFRVWGSRAFVRDLSADKLSPRAVTCVFLGFPPDAPESECRPRLLSPARPSSGALSSTSGMGLVLGGRRPVVLTGHADASWADDQATQRSSQGYTFSLGSGSVSWRSTRSSSVLSSSCEAEIYAGAMAAQELRWLTYLLTDLGEQPRSPPVLYVDNKAMLALCREHRLEHRTKHIALRYFLARELQQRGQLRLAYVAFEANTADIFTKALAPGDHQRFCTLLACFALLDWSCDLLFSPTLPMGVMEGTEKRLENDPEKSPWVRKSAQGYLLLGQALGSSQIRHIKPFQREPEKGPKAWAALKGVHAPATAAVVVVLERQMAALRIEEDETVEEGVQKFFDLLTRLEGADLNYSELQKKTKLLALLPESWSSLIINLNRDLPRLSLEDVKRAILQEDFRRRQEGRGAGRRRGRRGGGAASMKNGDNESESRDDRFKGQFFFVSTQAPAAPVDESFEEPAAVGKVSLHSLDYWVIDSGATYSMTPRADLLTELEPSLVKHVTSALGQRAEVKGMGKAMFKDADGKMVGLKNML
ncbi:unnamed protein product [Closterium sp. NIES-53]